MDLKKRAKAIFPNLAKLKITESEWQALDRAIEKRSAKKLSSIQFIYALSEIRNVDYIYIAGQLQKLGPARSEKMKAKAALSSETKKTFGMHRRLLKEKQKENQENTLITESMDSISSSTKKTLEKLGVQTKKLTPATPKNGVNRFKTPNSTRYRPLYSNKSIKLLFKETPETQRAQLANAPIKPIPLAIERPGPIEFTATLEKLEERIGQQRYPATQKQLTGGNTCHYIFICHGDEAAIQINGQAYHWAHIIPFFLGGEQKAKNLLATTRASNLNTLHIVERFVADLLTSKRAGAVKMRVTPIWPNEESFIPSMLEFTLNWQEKNEVGVIFDKEEKIYISPLSHEPVSRAILHSIETLREAEHCNFN